MQTSAGLLRRFLRIILRLCVPQLAVEAVRVTPLCILYSNYDTLFVRLQQKGCQTPSVAAYAMTPPSWREAFTVFPLRQGPLPEGGAGTAKP